MVIMLYQTLIFFDCSGELVCYETLSKIPQSITFIKCYFSSDIEINSATTQTTLKQTAEFPPTIECKFEFNEFVSSCVNQVKNKLNNIPTSLISIFILYKQR